MQLSYGYSPKQHLFGQNSMMNQHENTTSSNIILFICSFPTKMWFVSIPHNSLLIFSHSQMERM